MRSRWIVQEILERSRGDYKKYEKQEKGVKMTGSEIGKGNTRDRELGRKTLLESTRGASGHAQEHTARGHAQRRERKQVPQSLQPSSFLLVV